MMHFWVQVAGQSEFALRFPSVVAATLILPLLYALARRLLNEEAGFWAALLGSVSPFYLWYAQEARMYAWVAVLSLTSVYALVRLLQDGPRFYHWFVYALATLALLYTHYSGFLLLAAEGIVYGVCRGMHLLRERGKAVVLVLGLLGVALVPLAPYVWRTLQMRGIFGLRYRPLYLILAEAWSSFSLGLRDPVIQPLWLTAPFLVVFSVGLGALFLSRRREPWVVCLGYLLLPILLLYGISLIKPNYMNPRHLMVVSPAWELVMAYGMVTLRRRLWPGMVVVLVCVFAFRGWAIYDIFTLHAMWKDDIRGLVRYIEGHAQPGDAIVLHHGVIRLTFDYYYDGPYPEAVIPRYDLAYDIPEFRAKALEQFEAWAREYDRIWFVYGPPPTYFPHDLLPDWADANLCLVDRQSFEAWWTYVSVAAYDDAPSLFDVLPDGVHPLDVAWESEGLRLVGARVQDAAAGENAWLELYWRIDDGFRAEPIPSVRLLDEAGNEWLAVSDHVFLGSDAWLDLTSEIVMTDFRVPLPDDMPLGTFAVQVASTLSDNATAVGQLTVTRPAVREPSPLARARFAAGIDLVSAELAGDTFSAGYPLVGALSWQASVAPSADYQLKVRLTDLWGREVASGEMAPSTLEFPTSAWAPGDRAAGRLALAIPASLQGGAYRVQIGLADPANGAAVPVARWYGRSAWLTIGTVRVESLPKVTELPDDVEHLLGDVSLGDVIHLRGYDLTTSQAGEVVLTLYWQADASPMVDYHVFVHVGALDAQPVAQADGVPSGWQRPTTSWRADEVIVDTYTLSIADIEPGRYNLLVGMYDPAAGGLRPVTVVDGEVVPGGYVLLQEVER
jgi:hypothetical protein